MTEENYVSLNKIIIPNNKVREMSKAQKRQYLMITNMLRDLNLLQKLLLFVKHNDNLDEATESANITISFFFLKMLISKNHEMWIFIKNERILEYNFGEPLKSLVGQISNFFSDKKNEELFSFIRNKFGFHYEADPSYKDELESLLNDVMDTHEMDIWLSNADSGNEIFGSSNAVMLKVIFKKMVNERFAGDEESLMRQMFSLALKISRVFHDFYISYLCENVLKDIQLEDRGEFKIKAPLLSQVKLPLIVKCDKI